MTIDQICTVRRKVRLSDYTSVKIGGEADVVAYPEWKEFYPTLKFLADTSTPHVVLGRGSNTLISDEGYRGIVVATGKLDGVEVVGDRIRCQCGASLINVARIAKLHSLTGMEWAIGIPASIGGAIVTNAGAWGGCIGDVVESVTVFSDTERRVEKDELGFSYRSSKIASLGTVGEVVIRLKKGNPHDVEKLQREYVKKRLDTQPKGYSLGSVFKAHNGVSAGYYIDKAGLKGKRIGGAEVSLVHAGFILNVGGATARDYYELIRYVEKTVWKKFGITLEREIKLLGNI